MKKIIILFCLLFMLQPIISLARSADIMKVFDSTTFGSDTGSGTSIITLNIEDWEFDALVWQFSGTTGTGGAASSPLWYHTGTTISVYWGVAEYLPTNATENTWVDQSTFTGVTEWHYIMKQEEARTGATYSSRILNPYTFFIDPAKYLFIKVENAGVTDIETTGYVGIHRGDTYGPRQAIVISQSQIVFDTSSGTTQLKSFPSGTKCVGVIPNGDDIYYTVDGSTTPTTSYLEIADGREKLFTYQEIKDFQFTGGGVASGRVNFVFYNAYPVP